MQSVIQELQSSGHNVKMITGDSLWTAAEVARQVGIVQKRNGSFPQFFHLERCHSDTSNVPCKLELGNFQFVSMIPDSLDGNGGSGVSVAASDLDRLKEMVENGDASLCISGDALQDLMSGLVGGDKPNSGSSEVSRGEDKHALFDPAAQAILTSLVPLVSVFARHAPRQKEAIVAAINLGGFKTLMCGDGTNDMGK
jgi:cation-transporting ATPase 13A1